MQIHVLSLLGINLDSQIYAMFVCKVGLFLKWPPLESVKCLLFCRNYVFKKTLFFISTPEKVYLDKSISIFGGLEAEILTRVICGLCRPFLKLPPLESVFFCRLKVFCSVTSDFQNIHVDIDIHNICGLEADIIVETLWWAIL